MPQDATNRIEATDAPAGVWGDQDRRGLAGELGSERFVTEMGRLFDLAATAAGWPAVPPKPSAASSSTSTE